MPINVSKFVKLSNLLLIILLIPSTVQATQGKTAAMNASTDTAYRNPTATEIVSDSSSMFEVTMKWLFEGAGRKPLGPVPVEKRTRASFAPPRADELRVTWLG